MIELRDKYGNPRRVASFTAEEIASLPADKADRFADLRAAMIEAEQLVDDIADAKARLDTALINRRDAIAHLNAVRPKRTFMDELKGLGWNKSQPGIPNPPHLQKPPKRPEFEVE